MNDPWGNKKYYSTYSYYFLVAKPIAKPSSDQDDQTHGKNNREQNVRVCG